MIYVQKNLVLSTTLIEQTLFLIKKVFIEQTDYCAKRKKDEANFEKFRKFFRRGVFLNNILL